MRARGPYGQMDQRSHLESAWLQWFAIPTLGWSTGIQRDDLSPEEQPALQSGVEEAVEGQVEYMGRIPGAWE